MEINDALLEELQALFTKYKIEQAFIAIPHHEQKNYILLPYEMNENQVRHMATSLLHSVVAAAPPTLN